MKFYEFAAYRLKEKTVNWSQSAERNTETVDFAGVVETIVVAVDITWLDAAGAGCVAFAAAAVDAVASVASVAAAVVGNLKNLIALE